LSGIVKFSEETRSLYMMRHSSIITSGVVIDTWSVFTWGSF